MKVKKRILVSLFLYLSTVVIILTVVAVIYFNYDTNRKITQNMDRNLQSIVEFSESAYAIPLWNYDFDVIEELNRSLLIHQNILGLNFYSEEDFEYSIYKVFENDSFRLVTSDYPLDFNFSKKLDMDISSRNVLIQREDRFLGRLEIFYTDFFAKIEMTQSNLNIIFVNVVLAIFIIVLVYYFLSIFFIRPVLKLSKILEKVSFNKDYSMRLNVEQENEIGLLYEEFNNLLRNILKQNSERDKLEKEILKTKSFISNIIDSMPSLIVAVDNNFNVTLWNSVISEYTQITPPKIVGFKLNDVTNIFSEYTQSFHEVLKTKEPVFLPRKKLPPDLKKLFNISIYPLVSKVIEGLVLRADDVTELEQKEKQLLQVQKMETIGTLAGGIAHDFNNVLVGIIGTISLIQFKLEQKKVISFEDIADHLETLDKSSNRASEMVQQLLTLSKNREMIMAPVDLNRVLRHVIKICQNSFDKKVEIESNLFKEPAVVRADSNQIEQVILNLCINGYHAMTIMKKNPLDSGGVLKINLSRFYADKFFCMQHTEAENSLYWRLTISDNGVGMADEVMNRIFDPFYTTKSEGQGTGLGLAMVLNIIKQHNGFVNVYSEVDIGTVFNIYLPVLEKSEIEAESQHTLNFKRQSGLVLFADDEPTIRAIGKQMLETIGLEVILAKDGDETFQLFKKYKNKLKLVILDLIMPKKAGYQIFKDLKELAPDISIIITSGFDKDVRVEEMLKQGAESFIQKPYTLRNLLTVVINALNKKNID